VKNTPRKGTLAIQTNATLLNKDLINLIKKYKMEVGLSIDAPPPENESIRGESKKLIKGLELLDANDIPFNVTAVVSSLNIDDLPKLPLFLSGYKSIGGIGLDLLVDSGNPVKAPAGIDLSTSMTQLKTNLSLINKLRRTPIVLRELTLLEKAKSGHVGYFCEAHRKRSLAITPEGELYPCAQVASAKEYCLGTIHSKKEPLKSFSNSTLFGEHCNTCPLLGKCPGECPSRSFFNQGNPLLICDMYRALSL
jgi:uncharacterized protein